jgi:ABC-type lipoprotein export system ATPase subunit
MVTHDPRYHAYAQRTIHLFDGQIVDETVPREGAVVH